MMWQIITFFIVINVISSLMTWSKTREMSLKVSKFNQTLYIFFGGAFGVLLVSLITKKKDYKPGFLTLIIFENIGIYILLYELAIHVANR